MLYGSMQEKAKLWADTNTVKTVFVNNNEKTEALLQNNASCWSRLATPIIVEDLSKDEAVEFLMSGHFMERDVTVSEQPEDGIRTDSRMSLEKARQIFDLVGGRIIHLIEFKRAWLRGVKFEAMAEELKDRERERLKVIGVDPNGTEETCPPNTFGYLGRHLAMFPQ
jgi:hypothetical protein